jgi:hypothetical protein
MKPSKPEQRKRKMPSALRGRSMSDRHKHAPPHGRSMSDLAPFVAAFLRDKVVDDLLEENKQLRAQLNANITSSRKVRISGLGGEIYAEGRLDEDGHPILQGYWHLDLKAGTARCSSMEQFRAIELHIGDLHKIVLASNAPGQNYGNFNCYDPETRRADISIATFKGVCLFASVGPISKETFEEMPEEYDQLEIMDVFYSLLNDPGKVTLEFECIQFYNNVWDGWNVGLFGHETREPVLR